MAPAAEASTSSVLEAGGTVTIPRGTCGELDDVPLGIFDEASGTVPVVVRNNTSSSAHNLEPPASLADLTGRSSARELAGLRASDPSNPASGRLASSSSAPRARAAPSSISPPPPTPSRGSPARSRRRSARRPPTATSSNSTSSGNRDQRLRRGHGRARLGLRRMLRPDRYSGARRPLRVRRNDSIPMGGTSSFTVDLFAPLAMPELRLRGQRLHLLSTSSRCRCSPAAWYPHQVLRQ